MDLLLLSVDSLRLDHVSRVPGGGAPATPRFDRVSAGFAFCDRCFSVSSATRPVHMSLATGLYPFEHGVQGQHHSRVRRGVPRLFRLFRDAGFRVGLLSEAPSIFGGLDLGGPMEALDPRPAAGLAQLRDWIGGRTRAERGRCLFVHYWSTHAPYGAADRRAMGETARLLRSGRLPEVKARYRRAVAELFEDKAAPLLEGLALGSWAVVLFGDHGQSWTADELFHGRTLRNSVLRVPLYLHAPPSVGPVGAGRSVVSLVDLYPTLCRLFDLPVPGPGGFGRDLLSAEAPSPAAGRVCLAEIHPTARGADGVALDGADAEQRWSVFDGQHKLMALEDEAGLRVRQLVSTWTEEEVPSPQREALIPAYEQAYQRVRAASRWVGGPLESDGEGERLRCRLRALGYLD